ncbi:MAG: ABC transporter permease [Chloroflexi bacterium]|nr:ABC transporter permease [Chloroflexota bacterium]MBV9898248.1 ABC transporter permease [Chloroflexota bacterium]
MDVAVGLPELVVDDVRERPQGRRWDLFLQANFFLPVVVLLTLVVCALFAGQIAPYDPLQTSLTARLQPPAFAGGTSAHLLGTDKLGRDVLSRIIFGARVSLSVALLVILITATIGTTLGIVGGYLGGFTDAVLMRITDVSLAFPGILIALLLAVTMGPSFTTVVLAISMLGWAPYSRLIRGEVLKLRNADFVLQARIIGCSPGRIMLTHIFPNVINPLLILATLSVGLVILIESALSFLGAGIPPPTATWGSMVSDGRSLIDTAWWISFFPGLVMGLVVLSGNYLGDWLRDRLDPRLRQI